jgi:IS5 family transposase
VKKKTTKATYRIRNWKQYNKALINRGSLTLWIDEDVLQAWKNTERTGQRGAPRRYADMAIMCMLTLMEVYHLALRQTQGLMLSLVKLIDLDLPIPDYSTLGRRRKSLDVHLPRQRPDKAIHIVVDSTGMKVFGEGEWKVRQHGYSKRRTWRKLHIGVDEATGEIVAAVATTNDVADHAVIDDLLDQVDGDIEQVSGDGAYDKRKCYQAIEARQATAAIPPRKDAKIWRHGNSQKERLNRDENLRRIRQVGRKQWKKEVNYHRRSLAETGVFRLKTIFGEKVSAREFEGQAVQMLVRCAALNRMTHLGMPDSYVA